MSDDLPISTNYDISCEENYCPPNCENVFDLVHVSYLIRGGTRVLWQLVPDFRDPFPWSFQLQVGTSGNPQADDWQDVGLPVDNSFYAIDRSKRAYNRVQQTHYRVQLTTSQGVYYSDPVAKTGILGVRDWRLASEIIRKERLRSRYVAQDGYLLKRRISGTNCQTCLDLQTGEVTDPYCPECRGTGKQCGYFYPMSCIWADLSPTSHRLHQDDRRGVVQDIVVPARMLMLPLISEYDVWVSRKTDERYYIHTIQHAAEFRGVPLIAKVELRPAEFTDVIYDIEIPQQDAWLA